MGSEDIILHAEDPEHAREFRLQHTFRKPPSKDGLFVVGLVWAALAGMAVYLAVQGAFEASLLALVVGSLIGAVVGISYVLAGPRPEDLRPFVVTPNGVEGPGCGREGVSAEQLRIVFLTRTEPGKGGFLLRVGRWKTISVPADCLIDPDAFWTRLKYVAKEWVGDEGVEGERVRRRGYRRTDPVGMIDRNEGDWRGLPRRDG